MKMTRYVAQTLRRPSMGPPQFTDKENRQSDESCNASALLAFPASWTLAQDEKEEPAGDGCRDMRQIKAKHFDLMLGIVVCLEKEVSFL